jgi:hypothetical protein
MSKTIITCKPFPRCNIQVTYEVQEDGDRHGIGTILSNGEAIAVFEFDEEGTTIRVGIHNSEELVDCLDAMLSKFGKEKHEN